MGEREPAICFHASSCLLPWVREREASTLLTPVAAYHPHATLTSDSSAKGFVRCFFLGNCRQSYNLNKEYLRKNRRIFGFFQTGWEGLPPDSHFHCFLCFLNWHGQIQEDFYPFFLEIVLNPVLDTALKAKVLEQISNELPDFSCSPR